MVKPIEDLDLENVTDIFVEIFPDARLLEVLEHAERAERNLTAWGKTRDAEIMSQVASIIRRRLAN